MDHETRLEQREAARRKAEAYFTDYDARKELVKQELARASAANDAKTARLRTLRLAKEEADRIVVDRAKPGAPEAVQKPPKRLARKRVIRVRR